MFLGSSHIESCFLQFFGVLEFTDFVWKCNTIHFCISFPIFSFFFCHLIRFEVCLWIWRTIKQSRIKIYCGCASMSTLWALGATKAFSRAPSDSGLHASSVIPGSSNVCGGYVTLFSPSCSMISL